MKPLSMSLSLVGLLGGLGVLVGEASAITPTGYSFDQATACGTYCYHDGPAPNFGGSELTDGVLGSEGWAANGNADAWVGWYQQPVVNIDFRFDRVTSIDSVRVGSTQNRIDDVVLPSIDIYASAGGAWSFVQSLAVPEDAANDRPLGSTAPHGFLTLSGLGIASDAVRVVVRQSLDGPWSFVDEVEFLAPVPEPAGWLSLLAGLGLLAGVVCRQRAAQALAQR